LTDFIMILKGPSQNLALPLTLLGSPFIVSHIHIMSPSWYSFASNFIGSCNTLVYSLEGGGWDSVVRISCWPGLINTSSSPFLSSLIEPTSLSLYLSRIYLYSCFFGHYISSKSSSLVKGKSSRENIGGLSLVGSCVSLILVSFSISCTRALTIGMLGRCAIISSFIGKLI